ncbi:Riboflavin synthase subunit beta [Flavobacterium sp. 9AF]|uniref:riboflavin synthase subunit beta n=1 Tax=Flavobacterium sp. 9AF TaxID=2653142 RepID=UPI0012F3E976|nr:riboflavin synthase subunit beta [Flavobacterium sp. 9AF]VXC37654.1 Riboflavin synthase subunit beta [Flavobacterium sp. 9AF]
MGLLGKKKNKKFSYQPRYYDNKGEGNPFEFKHKFDDYRVTIQSDRGIKAKFVRAFNDFKNNQNREANRRILIIISVLILVFLLIIDFDLSIFKRK